MPMSLTRRAATRRRPSLAPEWLEERDVPALAIQLDYSYDTAGFFADPVRRAVLQQAANDLGAPITTSLAAIIPGGTNTWTQTFIDPSTGQPARVTDPVVGPDTVVVYIGARDLPGSTVAATVRGDYVADGSRAWLSGLRTRSPTGSGAWGASVAFDTRTNWYFGASAAGIGRTQVDFYSVAVHELGHVLGIGASRAWSAQVSGGYFVGPNAQAVYGGPVPLDEDASHWADGIVVNGQPVALDPTVRGGARVPFSSLDWAALQDLGWSFGGSAPPGGPVFTPPWVQAAFPSVVLTGDGMARAFTLNETGKLVAAGPLLTPFSGFAGAVRAATADFNGDGVADFAFGTGAGTQAAIRIINGADGSDLVGPTAVLDWFTGGVYVAAGDLNGDGRAELAVSADAGGGTRVTVFRVARGGLVPIADFFAFGDEEFRGGSRVALGDVNGDGAADLLVGAGIGGGPRVAVYDGRSLLTGSPRSLVPDFFALDPALRSGVFVTAADLDGDEFADVIYSTGATGGPRVRVVSGAVLAASPGQDAYVLPALADFFALDPADRSGLRIAARDLDADGRAELVVASGSSTNPQVRVVMLADMVSSTGPGSPIQDPFGGMISADGIYVG
jgi:hypothetical protein